MGKGERRLVTFVGNFVFTYAQASTRMSETEGLQES